MTRRLLVIDEARELCAQALGELGHAADELALTTTVEAALEQLETRDFDAVLACLDARSPRGLALCERLVGARPDTPVVVAALGAPSGAGPVIDALRAGAWDFCPQASDTAALEASIERALHRRRLRDALKRLESTPVTSSPPGSSPPGDSPLLLGDSPALQRVRDFIARVGPSGASVLIHGETGTGKELIARALHAASSARTGPFVAVNCAAVPQPLLESELFGHARGAFTDAKAERRGLFLEATGGTLFLDEIAELPAQTQPKLLRALQERTVRPLGSNDEIPFDVRLVAASNRNLEDEVRAQRFREDLLYRVNVVSIEAPPLRTREGDILLLAHHFLRRFASASGKAVTALTEPAAERLVSYPWPGNVRELENCIERAVVLARFDRLTAEDLPDKVREHRPTSDARPQRPEPDEGLADTMPGQGAPPRAESAGVLPMVELERCHIERVLGLAGGNKSLAAQLLGIDRRTLYRRLAQYRDERPLV